MDELFVLTLVLVYVIIINLASATTTWDKDIYWHPHSSENYYNFAVDVTDLGYVNMTNVSFEINGIKFSAHNKTNMTIVESSLTSIFANYTNTESYNMTVCGLSNKPMYFVWLDGVIVYEDLIPTSSCISFSINGSGENIIKTTGQYFCEGVCVESYVTHKTPQTSSYSLVNVTYQVGNCSVLCVMPFLNSSTPTMAKTWDLCPYGVKNGRNRNMSSDGYLIWYHNYTVNYANKKCYTEFDFVMNQSIRSSVLFNETRDYAIMSYNMPPAENNVTGLFQYYYHRSVT